MRGDTWVRDMVLREQQIWPTILKKKKKNFLFSKIIKL